VVGERLEEAQVVRGEQRRAGPAVEVDRADGRAAEPEGDAHQGSDPEPAHALEVAQALVGAGVERQERAPGAGLRHDAPAVPLGVAYGLGLEVADQPDRQLPGVAAGRRIALEQDHPALRSHDPERQVQDRLEEGVGIRLRVQGTDHVVHRA
jgi:hypothetical protein